MAAPSPAHKRRLWLLAPAVALAVFLAACAGGWLYARARLGDELDARDTALRRAGWTVALDGRRFGGFPFRLKLTQARATVIAPSGWGVEAPGLEAQAVIFDPTHWVFVAPQGLVLHRGAAGTVAVSGRALSASVSHITRTPWRVAMVGEGLILTPRPGARPSAFQRIGRWEAYLRPAADGSGDGEALLQITDALATPHSLVWNFAPGAPVTVIARGKLLKLSAFEGAGWGAKVRAWAAAGGALRFDRVEAHGGPTRLWARGGAISVGPDGRLTGAVPLEIRQSPQTVGRPAATPPPPAAADPAGEALDAARGETESGSTHLLFKGGQVFLGGLKVGPSPKVD